MTETEEIVEVELGPRGRADVDVLDGDVEATARPICGRLVVTFEGGPGETITLAVRGGTPDDQDAGGPVGEKGGPC